MASMLNGLTVSAQVGEPTGLTVTIKQGGATLATRSVTIGPGGDLPDIKITDGTPESHTQIGTVGSGSPIIMKIVTQDDPVYRILHMYIDVPISNTDLDHPGPTSLFDPANAGLIDVEVSNVSFTNGAFAFPQLQNNSLYYTEFMRDEGGHFYELPQANAYNSHGSGIYDIQVGGDKFLNANTGQYNFGSTPGVVSSWGWRNMINPGTTTTINDGTNGGLPSTGNGYVFELGLSVAFTAVPEPVTMIFVGGAWLFLLARRKKTAFPR